jgi:hypothetical protein
MSNPNLHQGLWEQSSPGPQARIIAILLSCPCTCSSKPGRCGMSLHPDKIQEAHGSRRARICARQSSVAQIPDHHKSRRRKHGLRDPARQLG